MDIEKIAGFLENLTPVTIRPELCSRAITAKSSCINCLDICPVQGVKFTRTGPKVVNCISCGLCIEACPNHVFQLNERQLMDIDPRENETLIITCPSLYAQADQKTKKFLTKISCLGELFPELSLYLLTSFSKVILIYNPEQCENCLTENPDNKLNISQSTNTFNLDLGNQFIIVNSLEATKDYINPLKKQPAHDRRSFFKSIFRGSKNMSQKILHSTLNQNNDKALQATLNTRQPLKNHYLLRAFKSQAELDYTQLLPYPKLNLNTCNFCGACSKLCPTGAIQISSGDVEKEFSFIPNLCTHCNICRDVCYFQGLAWGDDITIQDFLEVKPQVLGKAAQKVCEDCEQDFYDLNEQQSLCFLCRPNKEQLQFFHTPLSPDK